MAQIIDPIRLSDHFGVDESALASRGILNPNLNVDTGLFIDPLLLSGSRHSEFATAAHDRFEKHFAIVVKLLEACREPGDKLWREAERMLTFPEVKWTCLGYGSSSSSGSGSGKGTTESLIATAKQIIDLGVRDPDFFLALGLFEGGFGPDRISDMTAKVIMPDLLAFNERVQDEIGLPREECELRLKPDKKYQARLAVNAYAGNAPILLVPLDILRDLPIANDWGDVADASLNNAELRQRLNDAIGGVWVRSTFQQKDQIRRWALASEENYETLLDMIRGASPTPYDAAGDPIGELFWRKLAAELASREPLSIPAPQQLDLNGVNGVVEKIIEQFRFLVEDRRYSEELYYNGRPRPEKAAQRLFYAAAHSYCKANNLDLTPEADTGYGPVDFKVSVGHSAKVLVEVKLSKGKVVQGYEKQLERYKSSEQTLIGHYIVVDVGSMGSKLETIVAIRNKRLSHGEPASPIVVVDGRLMPSASKL